MNINLDRFPKGKQKVLTMSYDDGIPDDIRLIEIFNKYGIKGTFHINGGLFNNKLWPRLPENQIKNVYAGHEISAHGFTHQKLTVIPDEAIISEILRDREKLEEIAEQPVRGMSFPFGPTNSNVENIIKVLGMDYARIVPTTGGFEIPDNFLQWKGTCHHNDNLLDYGDKFLSQTPYELMLMYVWGHSFEFDSDDNWSLMEQFCEKMGGRDDIWYATNIEICDYINAIRKLRFSAKSDMVLNQSAYDVWISVNGEAVEIKSGATVHLCAQATAK